MFTNCFSPIRTHVSPSIGSRSLYIVTCAPFFSVPIILPFGSSRIFSALYCGGKLTVAVQFVCAFSCTEFDSAVTGGCTAAVLFSASLASLAFVLFVLTASAVVSFFLPYKFSLSDFFTIFLCAHPVSRFQLRPVTLPLSNIENLTAFIGADLFRQR